MTAKRFAPDLLAPNGAWQPWRPTAAEPWSRKWAAHLYRRTGFGYSRADLVEAERLGFEGTLALVLNGKPRDEGLEESLNDVAPIVVRNEESGDRIRSWWIYCMLRSEHPLREKMTLFWHNHFATSIVKVQSHAAMLQQNTLLRKLALGKFGALLQAVSRDEAMLIWLDSNSNVKERPNENFARELMELFSLGVGNYTEKDVREAARAFTGWNTDGNGFRFQPASHDEGDKTVLGNTGKWDGTDVVRIVLDQPAAARFLVRKLYGFFISESSVPADELLAPLCERFRSSDYDVEDLVETMLRSRLFYSEISFRKRIKSPVEFVLGAVQAIYRFYDESEPEYSPLPHKFLVSPLGAMGQNLFAPPNVKGWPGGRAWLNTSTLLERQNFAGELARGTLWNRPTQPNADPAPPAKAFDSARIIEEERASSPQEIVRALLDLYLPGGVRPEAEARLVAFASEGKPTGFALKQRVRETVHAIMAMPEYQLA